MSKAYSYLRFSTPEQSRGDSFRRQSELAVRYCEVHGLELDQTLTFHDLGVSSWQGQNLETGRLGDFLRAVQVGAVERGSFLLVESLDRISRQSVRKAFNVLNSIVDAGITLVTLNDNKSYDASSLDTDPMALMMALLIFMRANEESETKSRRVREARHNARELARTTGRPISSSCPGWLRFKRDPPSFVAIPDRVEIVRRIFREACDGLGQGAIAARLNSEGAPVFGTGGRKGQMWHRTYIAKILRSRTVLGVLEATTTGYVNGKKTKTPVDPIEGYYPAVIDPDTFARVQALTAQTRSPSRGRHAAKEPKNVFGGLLRCVHCGSTVTRTQKGKPPKNPYAYYICTRAKAGAGCSYVTMRCDAVEAAFRRNAEIMLLQDIPAGTRAGDLDEKRRAADLLVDELQDDARAMVRLAAREMSDAVLQTLRETEDRLARAISARDDLEREAAALSGQIIGKRLEDLRAVLAVEPWDIRLLNTLLRQTFERVEIDPEGPLVFHWRQGGISELPFGEPDVFKRLDG